jgi:hypothetical protein
MAFITLANARKIVLKSKLTNKNFEGNVYKQQIRFLNKYDENQLLAIQELLKNPEKYFKDYYEPYKVTDSFQYIYEEVQPSFHSDLSCPRLNANYQNFEIPEIIQEKGKEAILEFRLWFKKNIKLLDKPDLFVERLRLKFGVTYSLNPIVKDNSGKLIRDTFSLDELEQIIDTLIIKSNEYFNENAKYKKVLEKYAKRTFLFKKNRILEFNETRLDFNEVKAILLDFEKKFTIPLKYYLVEYYRLSNNPNLKINIGLMENLGFYPCQNCVKEGIDRSTTISHRMNQVNPWDIVNENLNFIIKMYSIHYNFSHSQIQNLINYLHLGSSSSTSINYDDGHLNIDISDYGFYYNANIVWDNELITFWTNYLIERSTPTLIREYSFPISQKTEIELWLNINLQVFLSNYDPIDDYYLLNGDFTFNQKANIKNLICTNYNYNLNKKAWERFKVNYYKEAQKDAINAINYYSFDQSEYELEYFFDVFKSNSFPDLMKFIFDKNIFYRIHNYLNSSIEDFSVEKLFLKSWDNNL